MGPADLVSECFNTTGSISCVPICLLGGICIPISQPLTLRVGRLGSIYLQQESRCASSGPSISSSKAESPDL